MRPGTKCDEDVIKVDSAKINLAPSVFVGPDPQAQTRSPWSPMFLFPCQELSINFNTQRISNPVYVDVSSFDTQLDAQGRTITSECLKRVLSTSVLRENVSREPSEVPEFSLLKHLCLRNIMKKFL